MLWALCFAELRGEHGDEELGTEEGAVDRVEGWGAMFGEYGDVGKGFVVLGNAGWGTVRRCMVSGFVGDDEVVEILVKLCLGGFDGSFLRSSPLLRIIGDEYKIQQFGMFHV